MAEAGRGFDAVVVGEPLRVFYGNQFGNTFRSSHYGVPLWVPEAGEFLVPRHAVAAQDRTSLSHSGHAPRR